MNSYWSLAAFDGIVLEDSYVLDVRLDLDGFVMRVDFRLLPEHPLWKPPLGTDVFSSRVGHLRFTGVRDAKWTFTGIRPTQDATGEFDFGAIDAFHWSGSQYAFEGDFGSVELEAQALSVTFPNQENE